MRKLSTESMILLGMATEALHSDKQTLASISIVNGKWISNGHPDISFQSEKSHLDILQITMSLSALNILF